MNFSTEPVERRFVILFHRLSDGQARAPGANGDNTRSNHWDLMFECNGQLLTWAVEVEPFKSRIYDAIQLPNHRLDYLTFEGPISAHRGDVKRTMAGSFCIDCNDVIGKELKQYVSEGQFRLKVFSDDYKRKISFQRESGKRWTLKMTAENCQQPE